MKKKLFTALEVLVWTVLFLIPTFFISTILNPDLDIKKHYYADFQDVNGVIIGSPVNYLGYNVGHVHCIQILPDRIRADIAITEEDFSLPKCSMIKIEESGIGGSRSLEISPCKDPKLKGSIYTQKPKRVSQMLEDYCDFVNSMNQAMGNMLNALEINLDGGECCRFQQLKKQSEIAQVELKKTNADLDRISAKAPQTINKCKNNIEKTLFTVQNIKFDPEKIRTTAIKNQRDLDKLNKRLKQHTAAEYKEQAARLYWKTEVITIIDKNKLNCELKKLNRTLESTQSFLRKIECNLQPESLNQTHEKIHSIRENTENLIKED